MNWRNDTFRIAYKKCMFFHTITENVRKIVNKKSMLGAKNRWITIFLFSFFVCFLVFLMNKFSKYLLVLKKSWRYLQGMSWGRLQRIFIVKIFHLPGRLEHVLVDKKLLRWRPLEGDLKTCLKEVSKICSEDVLKTCL